MNAWNGWEFSSYYYLKYVMLNLRRWCHLCRTGWILGSFNLSRLCSRGFCSKVNYVYKYWFFHLCSMETVLISFSMCRYFSYCNLFMVSCPEIAGMQSQLVCSGCRNMLLYPRGAPNVRCAICNTITPGPFYLPLCPSYNL